MKMALEDSRYCYSPTVESNSPALPNSPNSFSRNSSTASSPTTVCKYMIHYTLNVNKLTVGSLSCLPFIIFL